MLSENDLQNMKIAVAGLGVTGKAVTDYLLSKQVKSLILVDSTPDNHRETFSQFPNVTLIDQEAHESISTLAQCDLVIISPGISRDIPLFSEYLAQGKKLIGEIEFAYQLYHSHRGFEKTKLVAVTGSNGKTTTVSLMAEILNNEGLNTFVGGNIGTPFIKALEHNEFFDVILLELSSFQLESIEEFHPQVATILNIYANHQERYSSLESYFLAKWNITMNMNYGDVLLIPKQGQMFQERLSHLQCDYNLLENENAKEVKEKLAEKLNFEKYSLLGDHNIFNLNTCYEIAQSLELSIDSVQKAIDEFKGVEHRVEAVASQYPFMIVNDAKSTNLDATLSAIAAIPDEKKLYLIMGGKLRDSLPLDYAQDARLLKEKVAKVFLIGEAANELSERLKLLGIETSLCKTLEVVKEQARDLGVNDCLLFSPAFPSFDQFSNYADRGKVFKELFQ